MVDSITLYKLRYFSINHSFGVPYKYKMDFLRALIWSWTEWVSKSNLKCLAMLSETLWSTNTVKMMRNLVQKNASAKMRSLSPRSRTCQPDRIQLSESTREMMMPGTIEKCSAEDNSFHGGEYPWLCSINVMEGRLRYRGSCFCIKLQRLFP